MAIFIFLISIHIFYNTSWAKGTVIKYLNTYPHAPWEDTKDFTLELGMACVVTDRCCLTLSSRKY